MRTVGLAVWRRGILIIIILYLTIFRGTIKTIDESLLLHQQEDKDIRNAPETKGIVNVVKHHRQSNLISREEFDRNYKQLNRNFPTHLFQNNADYFDKDSCIQFPSLLKLRFSSTYWQSLKFKRNSNAYFFSAYYDERQHYKNYPVIRIISTIQKEDITSVRYCQLWFPNEKKAVISKVTSAIHMDPPDYQYHVHTYILTCEIPSELRAHVPAAVSLVEDKCDLATNVLTVHYNLPETGGEKEDFAICIKPLLYPEKDMSYHLVQYVELAKILGVSKIYVYNYAIHPNMSEVLRYYSNQNQVEVIPFTIPGRRPNLPAVQSEFLKSSEHNTTIYERAAHNDCFYMNVYKYKYIAFLDLDELIIPYNGMTWMEVIDESIVKAKNKKGSQYRTPSVYLAEGAEFSEQLRIEWTPDIPQYMSFLQNVYRTHVFLDQSKQIVDTERVLGISEHKPMRWRCIGLCLTQVLDTSLAIMSHFKEHCPYKKGKKLMCVGRKDTHIWEYKEAMIKQVDEALLSIGLL